MSEEPDSRRVWLDTSDSLFEDVLSSPPDTQTTGATSDPTADPAPPPAASGASTTSGPLVQWPDLDKDDEYAGRPDWSQWRRLQEEAAARAVPPPPPAPTPPPAPPAAAPPPAAPPSPPRTPTPPPNATPPRHSPQPGPATPPKPTPPKAPRRAGARSRSRASGRAPVPRGATGRPATPRRGRAVPWLLIVVLVMSGSGVVSKIADTLDGRSSSSSRSSGSSGASQPKEESAAHPPLTSVTPVRVTDVPLPAVSDPHTVRLEILAPAGTVGAVDYSGDAEQRTDLEHLRLPWAVQAPLTDANHVILLTGRDERRNSGNSADLATVMCRIYLDGVKVEESAGRGYASCDVNVNTFRTTRDTGDGAPLAAATAVTPSGDTVRPIPTSPKKVTFELRSTGKTGDVEFGTGGDTGDIQYDDRPLPAGWSADFPSGADFLNGDVSEYGMGADVPTQMCRILLDGVTVEQSLAPRSATCFASKYFLLGR